jgi:hypothetical protein
VTFADITVQIAPGLHPEDAQLVQGLAATRGGRAARAQEMDAELRAWASTAPTRGR